MAREIGVPEMVRAGPPGMRVVPPRTIGELGARVTGLPAIVYTCAGTCAGAFGVGGVVIVGGDRVMLLPPTTSTEFKGERETGVPEIVIVDPAARVVPPKTIGEPGVRVTGLPAMVSMTAEALRFGGAVIVAEDIVMLDPPTTKILFEGDREIGVPEIVNAEPATRVVPSTTIGESGARVTGLPAIVITFAGTFRVGGVVMVAALRVMLLPPMTKTEFDGERKAGVPEIVTAEPADRVVPS